MQVNEDKLKAGLEELSKRPPRNVLHYLLRNRDRVVECLKNGVTVKELHGVLKESGIQVRYDSLCRALAKFREMEEMVRPRQTRMRQRRTVAKQAVPARKSSLADLNKPSLTESLAKQF